jgi:hypothetical protein
VRSPPLKRQLLDNGSASSPTVPQSINVQPSIIPPSLAGFDPVANTPQPTVPFLPPSAHHTPAQPSPLSISSQPLPIDYRQDTVVPQNSSCIRSPGVGAIVGPEEEAVVYNFPRLLEDPTGRLRKSTFFPSYAPEFSLRIISNIYLLHLIGSECKSFYFE